MASNSKDGRETAYAVSSAASVAYCASAAVSPDAADDLLRTAVEIWIEAARKGR